MARAQTELEAPMKKALSAYCKQRKITEADLLRKLIFEVVGDSVEPAQRVASEGKSTANQQLNLWLGLDEVGLIDARARKEGFMKKASWAASVIRQALTRAPVLTAEETNALRESNRELAAIGRNLNQVAHSINIDRKNAGKMTPELFEALQDFIESHQKNTRAVIDGATNRWGVAHGE